MRTLKTSIKMEKTVMTFVMAAFFLAAAVLNTSCKKNDGDGENQGPLADNELAGSITGTRTLDATVEYLLTGALLVEEGAILTIPAGTVIKAQKGFGSYILVLQGGTIYVNGTADQPVIMTSSASAPAAGDWGGLIINGNAPLAGNATGSTEIHSAYTYGGSNSADNSGSITYLKLEYTGARSSGDVEHNGLTLNGVGNGTKIENIYVPNGSDDGIEFFGGTVNVKNLLVINTDDDMFDMTQGWSGTLENCYGVWKSGFVSTESDPSGVEADGNFDGNFPDHIGKSNFAITNMTIENNGVDMNNVLKIRRFAKATITNAMVKGSGTVKSSGSVIDMSDSKGSGSTESSVSITNSLSNAVNEYKWGSKYELVDGAWVTTDAYTATDFPNVKVSGGNAGCDASLFSWTGYTF